ncbi:hypothetical protein [Catenuloplanes atrovinosus]|uniref:SAM-dependent methyltransferase n=1 Tax=Catenuloplanes atrovinosus TaxID=137266 RepID=A0AAE3YMT4_9ACTN|nr:hypothetical protein [Catenuloplanes atrovinosus]MDR7275380.1 hypothetical protein [Catenuloplanes atrovinosus]
MSRRTADAVAWLETNPALEELAEAFPDEWVRVRRGLDALIARDDAEEIKAYITRVSQPEAALPGRSRSRRDRLLAEVRRQMSVAVLKREILSATTGVSEGRVRFNLINGYVAQRLLFRRGLERKPVRMGVFRAVWPLLGQRRLLMPLVQRRGIWCFYSKPLITRLARLIGDRSCLEIAAGDGTLSRFLARAGVRIVATDDHSWSDSIEFPESVLRQDARAALRAHAPEVVICSWPPAGNDFERHVFTTESVRLYVVIGSKHRESTGDWAAYERQDGFTMTADDDLGRLVLPPEVEHAVYVFRRRT